MEQKGRFGMRCVSKPARRRQLLVAAGALLAAEPLASRARQQARLVRIGVLIVPSAAGYAARTDALRAGLRELGYVEGENVQLEFRSAEGKFDRLPPLAADLVGQRVDVLVVAGTPAIRAAKQATGTVPIVIAAVGDAVAGGLVADLSRPGGNLTGSTYFARELATKQLELLREAFPHVPRVAVIFNPGNPAMGPTLQAVESAAGSLRLELERFAVREPPDFAGAFATISRHRHRTALIIDDPITISNAKLLAELAIRNRLASGANFLEYAEAGGLMGYGVDLNAMWRRAAFFVDRIVKGARPGEIAMERSTRFDLVVNRRTATAIDVDIAPSILLRAARVIE